MDVEAAAPAARTRLLLLLLLLGCRPALRLQPLLPLPLRLRLLLSCREALRLQPQQGLQPLQRLPRLRLFLLVLGCGPAMLQHPLHPLLLPILLLGCRPALLLSQLRLVLQGQLILMLIHPHHFGSLSWMSSRPVHGTGREGLHAGM